MADDNEGLPLRIALTAFANVVRAVEPSTSSREGLALTPMRAAKALMEKTSGYHVDVASLFKTFEHVSTNKGMVVVRNIEVESMCEHHLERIWGVAHIAYIPAGRVLGLSKFQRIVDAFARRFQIQEQLTAQIADAINTHLEPIGVGVVIEARHACMESRGVRRRGQTTLTSELRGAFYHNESTRAEFLSLARTSQPL